MVKLPQVKEDRMKSCQIKLFRIDYLLNYTEISYDEIKPAGTLHFIEIFFNPENYKSDYTYLSCKVYDKFFKPSCLKFGRIKAIATRKSDWAEKWDESSNYHIDDNYEKYFHEFGPMFHKATYEILIQDVYEKNSIISFSRPNKRTTKNAILPIIKCLEKMKELDGLGTWKALDLAKEFKILEKEKGKIAYKLNELAEENSDLIAENTTLRKYLLKITKESKAINRLEKIFQSPSFKTFLDGK